MLCFSQTRYLHSSFHLLLKSVPLILKVSFQLFHMFVYLYSNRFSSMILTLYILFLLQHLMARLNFISFYLLNARIYNHWFDQLLGHKIYKASLYDDQNLVLILILLLIFFLLLGHQDEAHCLWSVWWNNQKFLTLS